MSSHTVSEFPNSNATSDNSDAASHPTRRTMPFSKGLARKRSRQTPYQKPRFNQPDTTSYVSKHLPTPLLTSPILLFHPLFTSLSGPMGFASMVYDVYASRDPKLEKQISTHLLQYVTSLAVLFRITSVSRTIGYGLSNRLTWFSDLKELISSLILPESICHMVESIGSFEMPHGITIVPKTRTSDEFFSDAAELRRVYNILVPSGNAPTTMDELISAELVTEYATRCVSGFKYGLLFRPLELATPTGKEPFCVTYTDVGRKRSGKSPCAVEILEAKKGASYGFRSEQELRNNPAPDLPLVHAVDDFDVVLFTVEKIANAMHALRS